MQHEIEVLRILNGETVEGWVAGAAINACCAYLKGQGLATGHYQITNAGRAFLVSLEARKDQP
jgi:hypothetical protein